jgi:hypothetical protein
MLNFPAKIVTEIINKLQVAPTIIDVNAIKDDIFLPFVSDRRFIKNKPMTDPIE